MMYAVEQILAACFFAVLCWGVGARVWSRAVSQIGAELPRWVVEFAAGAILFSYILTLLGVCGQLTRPVFLFLLLLSCLAFPWREARRRWRKIGPRPTGPALLTMAALIVFYFPSALMALAPPFVRDTLVYHLALPKAYLAAGKLVFLSGNFFAAYPKGQEMILTLLLGLFGEGAAQFFSVVQQLAVTAGIYGLIRSRHGGWPAAVGALGYATLPAAAYFSGCAYVEPAVVLALVAGLIALAGDEGPHPATAALAGWFGGWSIALKYNGALYAALLGAMLLWQIRRRERQWLVRCAAMFAIAAMPGLFWNVRNWLAFGNPVYPFAYAIFGGPGWDSARAQACSIFLRDHYGMGRSVLDYLLIPWRLSFLGRFDSMQFDGYLGPFVLLFVVFGLASAVARRREDRPLLPGLGAAILAAIAFFVFGTQQARFYLPAHAMLAVYGAPVFARFCAWGKGRPARSGALLFALFAVLVWNAVFWYAEAQKLGFYRPVFRLESRAQFLARQVPGYPAIEYINTTPPSARVLAAMTGNYGYYLDRFCRFDAFIEDYTLRSFLEASVSAEDAAARIKKAGYSYLFLNAAPLAKSLPPPLWDRLRQMIAEHGRAAFENGNFVVIEMRKK